MTLAKADTATKVAEDYYDSDDADRFYATVWGGEDIHIGLYQDPGEDVKTASRRTVEYMAGKLKPLGPEHRVIDLGAGYGGAARYLAKTFGCKVVCLNVSETQNRLNRELTAKAGLDSLVTVMHGSFEDIPFPAESFDVVWSQDAFLHSGNRQKVVTEAARVLKPGGRLIFTDPMQADTAPKDALQPILDRIHLSSMGSVGFYSRELQTAGFETANFLAMTDQLKTHYSRIAEELAKSRKLLAGKVAEDYVERMLTGLANWVKGAESGHLAWGVLQARKAATSHA
ncbi:MAG: methyltransferase domain-containing protein [Rhodobacteraceae bacterium]|nr:methyltransferase domain-containing protein [Paracoccaceae bacterium]